MNILTSMKLQILKLRHGGFWLLHLLMIFGVTLLLDGYYVLYSFKDSMSRMKLIYEFIGILIPILVSITIAFLVRMEEQTANLYGILAVRHRKKVIMGLLLFSWTTTVLQVLIQTISLVILGDMEGDALPKILLLGGGMAVFSFFFHLFHLFLHLRFGIGVSLLVGVFECMQSVMYSNVQLAGIFQYIPSAWLMEWKACILAGGLREQWIFWIISLSLLLTYLILFLIWFEHWEGKNNGE